MIYIAFILFTLLVLAFFFYQWQYFMVFSPTLHRETPLCTKCQLLGMQTDDDKELEGVLYEPQNARHTILVFLGRSHDAVGLINKLSKTYTKSRIISFNYRSYGKSEGRAEERELLSDGLKIASLVEKNYGSFYILGFSLGSNIAAYVASQHEVKALFLIGAFDSIASLAKSKFVEKSFFPDIDLSKVFRYKFRTVDYVQEVRAPSYLFVSKDDEVTYIKNARNLQDKVKNLAYYKEFDGLSHQELLWSEVVTSKINEVINV